MKLKKNVIEEQENSHLQDNQLHTKPASSLIPSAVVDTEVEVEQPVEDNDELNVTPTSPLKTIKPILKCPSAPRKPKATPMKKRKASLRLLDYSNDVLAMYPSTLLADFGNKLKKAKRSSGGYHHEHQFKENISTNVNCYYSTKLQTKHD